MDNLFLKRDLLDICKLYNIDVGIISLDEEKALIWLTIVFFFPLYEHLIWRQF